MMREFFRGWRRKAGTVTLVMACVLSLLWYRSQFFGDRLTVGPLIGVSQFGEVSFGYSPNISRLALNSVQLHGVVTGTGPGGLVLRSPDARWRHFKPVISYWPLAILLTLLSAYLILWKSRKREYPN